MTGFLQSVIAVIYLLCLLVVSLILLTKEVTEWFKALKDMIAAFHDLWKSRAN